MSLRPADYQEAKSSYKPMRRTGFKPKPVVSTSKAQKASENENTLKARPLQRRSTLKPGRKMRAWKQERGKLKKRFERVGITTCELKGVIEHDCKVDDYLSFAHSTKRNDPLFNISEVILACIPGHQILDEQMSHEEMYDKVKFVIAHREIQP